MMTFFPSVLANVGAVDILTDGINTSRAIAQTWDKQWQTVFNSSLFTAINDVAIIFAVGALLFFVMNMVRQLVVEGDITQFLPSLLWPLLVVALLANNSQLLVVQIQAMRSIIHDLSNNILEITFLEVNVQDAIQAAATFGAVNEEISAQLRQCQGMVGSEQMDCLRAANEMVEATISGYQRIYNLIPPGLQDIHRAIQGAVELATVQEDPFSAVTAGSLGFLGGLVGSTIQNVVQVILLAMQWAFSNILEISLLLTALMGPFAVAGTLLPFGGKPLFAWMTGFFALGMAKVSYNIICGLAAVVVVNGEVWDTLGFLMMLGLFAPALSLAMAAGGGMALFRILLTSPAQLGVTLASRFPAIKL